MLRSIANRPTGIKIALAVLILLSFASIGGGIILLVDPSGGSMGVQTMIPYLPFNLQDFFLVGVWLITAYGALPIILGVGLWFGKTWAWLGALGLGVVVVTWILAEIYLFYPFGFAIFYPLIGGAGVLTIAMLLLRSSREYCKSDTAR